MTVNLTSTDNLALAAAIRDLQTQVTMLRRSSLQLGPHQMGSVAGEASNLTLRASRILPPNFTGPYMELDLTQVPTNNTTRLSPALHVNDGTQERVQLGNLGPNGISPAQYGLRVNDASGTPIFDSLGLIAVMTQLGFSTDSVLNTFASFPPTVIPLSPVTFSLTRSARVLVLAAISGSSATRRGFAQIWLDGVADANSWGADWGAGGVIATGVLFSSDQLAAGSHTYDLRAGTIPAGGTMSDIGFQMNVFLMGT